MRLLGWGPGYEVTGGGGLGMRLLGRGPGHEVTGISLSL